MKPPGRPPQGSHFFLDFPALDMAMATAWFLGFPARISVAMFSEITFLDLPFFRGTALPFGHDVGVDVDDSRQASEPQNA